MNDVLNALPSLLGIGGGLAVFVLLILFAVKGAIATAVTQAANRELIRLRGEIDVDLQSRKDVAALALEQFRAQLTLEAEVRRQTAVRRVDALLKISDATIALVRAFHGIKGDEDRQKRFDALVAWGHLRVELEVLFGVDALPVLTAFEGAATEVNTALNSLEIGVTHDPKVRFEAENKIGAARMTLFEWVRRELQIASTPISEPSTKGAAGQ